MNMSKIMELRTKRNTLWEQTKAFLEKHRGENGLVEASAVEQYNKMAGEVQALGAEIERLEQQAQIEASKQTVSMLVIDKKRLPLKQPWMRHFPHRPPSPSPTLPAQRTRRPLTRPQRTSTSVRSGI